MTHLDPRDPGHSAEGPRFQMSDMARQARAALGQERGLFVVGVTGLVIAALCLVAVGVRGSFIPPEGKMLDAATFTFGVGLFALTIALLLPLAGYTETARRRWRRLFYVFAVYGLVLEPLQAFRGLDPRFTEAGGALDVIAGIIFGLTAGLFTVLLVILGLRFFRGDVLADRPTLRAGIRYGMVAVWLSFGVGLVMSVAGGRAIGEAGDLMPTHALGVHGIQALPIVALLLGWAGTGGRVHTWIQAAGIGWLAATTATLVQALLGRPPLDPTPLLVVMGVGLAVWTIAAGYAFAAAWRRLVPARRFSPGG